MPLSQEWQADRVCCDVLKWAWVCVSSSARVNALETQVYNLCTMSLGAWRQGWHIHRYHAAHASSPCIYSMHPSMHPFNASTSKPDPQALHACVCTSFNHGPLCSATFHALVFTSPCMQSCTSPCIHASMSPHAGEAGVSFFSIAASEFVELYVGMGASRVRQLFEAARKVGPSRMRVCRRVRPQHLA